MPKYNQLLLEMKKMDNAIVIPVNQKILSNKDLKDYGFTQYKIRKLVDEGKLVKLNKSFYENCEYKKEDSDFYYVKVYAPNGVVCLLSAAVYYNLTTFIPGSIDVAIPRKSKVSKIPERPRMNIHYFTDARYNLGINVINKNDNEFKIYDIEKTVVDIVFYKEKIGIEETKEILINYLNRKERNLNKLLKYSKMMKCEKILRRYLEVLV